MKSLGHRAMYSGSRFVATWLMLVGLSIGVTAIAPAPLLGQISFNRDIRPILAENCFFCHGPDARQRAADLRLDFRESAVEMGVIDPGDPDSSALIERIRSKDADEMMPPPHSLKKLSAAQKDLLEKWIAEGAAYEQHWAYLPPKRDAVPDITNNRFVRTPIDNFVQSKLAAQQLAPAAEADPATLVRRIYLDLVGLPPSPQVMEKIREQGTAWDYSAVVDELLASPHFGERMAAGWLDVVRYADTVGYHGDQNRNAFPYRDWVIDAFNRNLPFDEFTRQQLAGDLLPNPSSDQLVATCFNRLNMMTREGGAQPQEYLAKYSADRVRTVGGAWLGSTVGCAECHDHKYDPFTTRDFYQLAAFFADIKQWGVYQDYQYTPNPDLRGWSNDHPFPPEIEVDVPYLQSRLPRLIQQRQAQADTSLREFSQTEDGRKTLESFRNDWRQFSTGQPDGWKPLAISKLTANEDYQLQPSNPGWQVAGKSTANLELVALFAEPISSIRLELLPSDNFDGHIFPAATRSRDLRVTLEVLAADGTTRRKVNMHFADSTAKLPRYYNGFEIHGVHQAWIVPNRKSETESVWILDRPLQLGIDERLVLKVTGNQAEFIAITVSPWVPVDLANARFSDELLQDLNSAAGEEWLKHESIQRSLLTSIPALRKELDRQRRFDAEIRECRGGRWPVMVTESQQPIDTRVLPRGDWQNQSGDLVQPAFPEFLSTQNVATASRLTRLDLANWLVAAENPLTARVQVNRFWKHFFGVGLSPVLDDLGIQGQYPNHPELLDWLAIEFRESGWDVKHIIRLIVLSHTYRQSSKPDEIANERDAANIWLSHQNPRRLEAEIVRDQALAVSGLIALDFGGPPIFPYQPEGYYRLLQFPDRNYLVQSDERQYRRSVYMHWQRTFLHPMLANFDAPPREECTAMRTEANTPQQALTLLNDPSFVRAALKLSENLLALPEKDDGHRIDWLYRQILGRAASNPETKSLQAFIAGQREHWQQVPDDVALFLKPATLSESVSAADRVELATWANVARTLLNLHETITRY